MKRGRGLLPLLFSLHLEVCLLLCVAARVDNKFVLLEYCFRQSTRISTSKWTPLLRRSTERKVAASDAVDFLQEFMGLIRVGNVHLGLTSFYPRAPEIETPLELVISFFFSTLYYRSSFPRLVGRRKPKSVKVLQPESKSQYMWQKLIIWTLLHHCHILF